MLKKICLTCGRAIKADEVYQVCSECNRNYHIGHDCPLHSYAEMIPSRASHRPKLSKPFEHREVQQGRPFQFGYICALLNVPPAGIVLLAVARGRRDIGMAMVFLLIMFVALFLLLWWEGEKKHFDEFKKFRDSS